MENTQMNSAAVAPIIRDRIRELRRVRAHDLVPHPKNWRVHPRVQKDAMRALLSEIGFADAVLVRELPDGRFMIVDGHLRAELNPDTEIPALVLDLTEAEAEKLLLTLDPLTSLAESDTARIQTLLETVQSDSEAVQELLRRIAGEKLWAQLHPQAFNEAEVPAERAEELKARWGTKIGQLWQAGEHRVIGGNSADRAVIERLWDSCPLRFRMISCDPPYGVSYSEKTRWTSKRGRGRHRRPIQNDTLKPEELRELFATALKVAREYALPGAAIYATVPSVFLKFFIQGLEDGGFAYKQCLIWRKQSFVLSRSDYHYQHEPILYGWLSNSSHYFISDRSQSSVFEVDRPMVSELHATTKPVALITRMIANSTHPGELVFDPFCGSGTTLVAAHQLKRVGFGCEIDPAYLAVELERLSMLGLKPELVSEL
jgi:DNA modification methylase